MNIRVALFYDQYTRDFEQLVKIGNELEKSGAVCRIAPSVEMLEHSAIFKPNAIVIGNPDLYHGEFATLLSEKKVVFSIPTEQSIFSDRIFAARVVDGHNKNDNFEPPNISIINRFFLWSEYHRKSLLKRGVPENKLFVSGNPRLTPVCGEKEPICIGVPLESDFDKCLPYNLWNSEGVDVGYGPMLDYWNLALNVLYEQLMVIRALTKKGYRVIVRPRMSDMETDYSFLGEGVEIDRSKSPSYLLNKCGTIITGQSTIGLEAYIYGAKVITVLGMVKQSLITDAMKSELLFQHPLRPSSMDELLSVVDRVPSDNGTSVFLKKVRFYLGADISTPEKRIADEIIRVMKECPCGVFGQEHQAAVRRILKKFRGIKGVWIKNRENVLGVFMSRLLLAKRRFRRQLSFGR